MRDVNGRQFALQFRSRIPRSLALLQRRREMMIAQIKEPVKNELCEIIDKFRKK
ncbi:hypothetical protein X777_05373 [Ooceraea biroi]|uniref:Uncharacterized protein n=1 Tax=Ooceraea biroi TaxID=2015173 RepID=A0A026WFI3_OOCBI|nr:hypothetical protein X777_05373 [Ooceraea biroi]